LGDSNEWCRGVIGTWMWRQKYMWDVGANDMYRGIVNNWF
jgi:hypothetical protein